MPIILKKTAIFLLFWAIFTQIHAQSTLIGEPVNIRNDYGYELVGRLKDHVLLFRDKYNEFEIKAFDNHLREDWEKEIILEKHGVQVLGVIGGKRDFSVIYRAKRKGEWLLRQNKYDAEAELIDSVTLKKWPTNTFFTPKLELIKSDDRNCIAVYDRTSGNEELPVTCFRLDKMQLLWDKKIAFGDGFSEANLADISLSNDGDFFIVSDLDNRKARIEEHRLEVVKISAGIDKIWQIAMPEFLTYDLGFSFDEKNKRFVGAGFYGEKNVERAVGYFFTAIDPATDFVEKPRFEPFGGHFLSVFKGKEIAAGSSRGLEDLRVRQLVFRQDGGILLIGEQSRELVRGSMGGRPGFRGDVPRTIIDHFYDDFFVIATNPNGSPHWETVLHKKQYSQDDDAAFSSFFTIKTPERLHFLFNDEIRFENTCSEYLLDPAGHFDRNGLLNTADQQLRLRFREGLQISATEALVPSEHKGKLRLVLFKFDGTRL